MLNPKAGSRPPDKIKGMLAEGFSEDGWTYHLHEISVDESIEAVIREAPPDAYDVVVASGGDGTVSGVAGALVGTGVPLGIIPSGTGNSLARDLGIPMKIAEAVKILTDLPATRPVDALQVEDTYHFLNLSIGVSAAAMLKTPSSEKRQFGMAAYLLEGVSRAHGAPNVHLHAHPGWIEL